MESIPQLEKREFVQLNAMAISGELTPSNVIQNLPHSVLAKQTIRVDNCLAMEGITEEKITPIINWFTFCDELQLMSDSDINILNNPPPETNTVMEIEKIIDKTFHLFVAKMKSMSESAIAKLEQSGVTHEKFDNFDEIIPVAFSLEFQKLDYYGTCGNELGLRLVAQDNSRFVFFDLAKYSKATSNYLLHAITKLGGIGDASLGDLYLLDNGYMSEMGIDITESIDALGKKKLNKLKKVFTKMNTLNESSLEAKINQIEPSLLFFKNEFENMSEYMSALVYEVQCKQEIDQLKAVLSMDIKIVMEEANRLKNSVSRKEQLLISMLNNIYSAFLMLVSGETNSFEIGSDTCFEEAFLVGTDSSKRKAYQMHYESLMSKGEIPAILVNLSEPEIAVQNILHFQKAMYCLKIMNCIDKS